MRLNPDTGATAAVDGTLTYRSGDAGAGSTPRVVGSAYTNSVAGATTTTLFALDAGRDALAVQSPPNAGTLVSAGSLGVDAGDNTGFDISSVDGVAYAALQVSPSLSSRLYRINLTTGAATLAGRIGGSTAIRALAAAGTAPTDTAAPTLGIATRYSRKIRTLLRTGVTLRATCSESCRITARILLGRRQIGGGRTLTRRRRNHDVPRRLHHRGEEALRQEQTPHPDARCHRPGRLGQHGHKAHDASRQALVGITSIGGGARLGARRPVSDVSASADELFRS